MNTEPIPYPLREIRNILRLDTYCKGAWSLCYTTLWPELNLDEKEQEAAKEFIAAYFDFAEDKLKSFINFCERIILTGKYVQATKNQLPPPSIWFDPDNTEGFRVSAKILRSVNTERQLRSHYLRHYTIGASRYLRFILHPDFHSFDTLCVELMSVPAPVLLHQFHKATLYFSNPKMISL